MIAQAMAALPVPQAPQATGDVMTLRALAIYNKTIFVVILIGAFFLKLDQVWLMMVGAAINMAMNPDNFYYGSSAGSARKDAVIAQQAAEPAIKQ